MATPSLPQPAELAKTRTTMLATLPPLQAEVQGLTVTTDEEYQYADHLLTRVRASRAWWLEGDPNPKSKWRGINQIIKPFYEGLQGLYELRTEGSKPHDEMEAYVKGQMKAFKVAEATRLAEERQAKYEEEVRLQKAIEDAKRKEDAAKTVQTRTNIIEKRMNLEQQKRDIEKEVPTAVKAARSSARTIRKPVVKDFIAFVTGIVALADDESVPLDLLMVNTTRLAQLWKDNPELVAQLPGIEIESEIVIAGR